MSLDFKKFPIQAKYAVYINEGCSWSLHGKTGCPYRLGSPEAEAFIFGYNTTEDAIKGK